jgi:hypothetical protein
MRCALDVELLLSPLDELGLFQADPTINPIEVGRNWDTCILVNVVETVTMGRDGGLCYISKTLFPSLGVLILLNSITRQ